MVKISAWQRIGQDCWQQFGGQFSGTSSESFGTKRYFSNFLMLGAKKSLRSKKIAKQIIGAKMYRRRTIFDVTNSKAWYQGKGDPVPPNDNLYVKGLPASVTQDDVLSTE